MNVERLLLCLLSLYLLYNYQAAERYARRRLQLTPWQEETHRQVMRLPALAGRQDAALDRSRIQLTGED